MKIAKYLRAFLLIPALSIGLYSLGGALQPILAGSTASDLSTQHDGQHDFDFALGRWKTRLSRLQHPLTGSTTWINYEGASVVRKVWDGRASLEEFEATGPAGHIEGLTLRTYNPETRQWSQSWATGNDGILSQPMIGEFSSGRGESFDQESFHGRKVYVRWVWSNITQDSCRFEQSFSPDGGKSWEVNWINQYTRIPDTPGDPHAQTH